MTKYSNEENELRNLQLAAENAALKKFIEGCRDAFLNRYKETGQTPNWLVLKVFDDMIKPSVSDFHLRQHDKDILAPVLDALRLSAVLCDLVPVNQEKRIVDPQRTRMHEVLNEPLQDNKCGSDIIKKAFDYTVSITGEPK